MKVSIMKLIGSLFCAVLLMTSCLGSGDSSYQADGVFAYITYVNNRKCASTNIGNVATRDGAGMSSLAEGQCYFISFKITNVDVNSNGVYEAEYINVLNDGYPVDQNRLAMGKPYYDIDESMQQDSIHITSMGVEAYYPTATVYGDCWMFKYSVPSVKEGDDIVAHFYYDFDNQVDENGKSISIGDNKAVIDVRFIKRAGSGSGSERTKDFRYIGGFENLRSLITASNPKYDSDGYARVAIKFRYVYPAQGQTPSSIKYFPANGEPGWNGDGNAAYIMFFDNNN